MRKTFKTKKLLSRSFWSDLLRQTALHALALSLAVCTMVGLALAAWTTWDSGLPPQATPDNGNVKSTAYITGGLYGYCSEGGIGYMRPTCASISPAYCTPQSDPGYNNGGSVCNCGNGFNQTRLSSKSTAVYGLDGGEPSYSTDNIWSCIKN